MIIYTKKDAIFFGEAGNSLYAETPLAELIGCWKQKWKRKNGIFEEVGRNGA